MTIPNADHGPLRRAACAAVLLGALGLSACGGDVPTYEITDVRERPASSVPVPPAGDSASRLGLGTDPHAGVAGMEGAFGTGGGPVTQPKFAWVLPKGWVALPPMQAVEAGFGVGGDPDARMTLSLAGGALADNVNRWRRQMGLGPASDEEIEALPRHEVLGQDAVLVDLEGAFQGMRGQTLSEARLLGLVVQRPGQSVFLKLLGPTRVVEAERERFFAFASSLQAATASMPAGHPPMGETGPGMGGGPARPSGAVTAPLAWDVPASWKELPSRPPRLATFRPEGAADAQCLVTVLSGSGGGLAQNLNEWRRQLGQEPLTDEAYTALERLEILATTAVLITIEGETTASPDGPSTATLLYGAIAPREQDTVFVKMWGPTAEMAGEAENFRAFVGSLRE
jgi:hypothetical protein